RPRRRPAVRRHPAVRGDAELRPADSRPIPEPHQHQGDFMSQPQAIPTVAPHARPGKGSATHDAAAPPGDGFAPALADAVAGTGPPGRPVDGKATRTAVAEGDKAGSDSSGAGDETTPAATGDAAAALVLAIPAGAVALPGAETPAAVDPAAA